MNIKPVQTHLHQGAIMSSKVLIQNTFYYDTAKRSIRCFIALNRSDTKIIKKVSESKTPFFNSVMSMKTQTACYDNLRNF